VYDRRAALSRALYAGAKVLFVGRRRLPLDRTEQCCGVSPADLHEQRIGVMAPTQAFFGYPRPATSVSTTKVFPARLTRRQWQNGLPPIGETAKQRTVG